MAEAGSEVSFVAWVRAEPVQVAQAVGQSLSSGGNYLEDTQVVPVGPTTFRVTRRYVPQWAIIVGIIGLLLCLIGIFAIFIRDTDELTIDIQPNEGGSRITVSGKAKGSVITTVQNTLARFDGYTPSVISAAGGASIPVGSYDSNPPPPASPVQLSEDRAWWWNGASWQSCETSAPPQAERSPDGTQWWDGSSWRPLPEAAPASTPVADPPSSPISTDEGGVSEHQDTNPDSPEAKA